MPATHAGDKAAASRHAAVRYMCLAVLGCSLIPLLIVTVGGAVSPFLLGGSQAVGHVVGGLGFLSRRYPRSMRN